MPEEYRATTDAQGNPAAFDELPVGRYRFLAIPPTGTKVTPEAQEAEIVDGQTTMVDPFRLLPAVGSARVPVVDPAGAGIAGVVVVATRLP